ncbi:MAG TPA: ATP synthase subunit I [Rudaea sp.]|nr:ATP synthase subunit I [Rudaea sp.]
MQNSIAAGRRLAIRVVAAQIVATLLVAAGFAWRGWSDATGVLAGGGVVVLGTAVLALRLFAGPPAEAGTVLARMIVGNLLRWCVIGAGLYLAMVVARLPGLPVLAGLIAALLPQLFGLHEGFAQRNPPATAVQKQTN